MKVKCMICGKFFHNLSPHLRSKHKLTKGEYLRDFPDAKLTSDELRIKRAESISGDKNPMKCPEVAEKQSQLQKGREFTDEHKANISKSCEGRIAWNKGKTKENDVSVEKYAESLRGRERSLDHCKHISESRKGKCTGDKNPMKRPEIRAKFEGDLNPAKHPEVRQKISDALIGRDAHWMMGELNPMKNPKVSAKVSKTLTGRECVWLLGDLNPMKQPEIAIKVSNVKKEQWQDPDFVRKMVKSWNIKPNKPEKRIESLLNLIMPNEYKYNDGWFTLHRKIPDFVNINGRKSFIEFNGDYWHDEKETKKRVKLFKSLGYETLVIWQHEMDDMITVVNKIFKFHGLPKVKGSTVQTKLGR